jgi:hypothetical protein
MIAASAEHGAPKTATTLGGASLHRQALFPRLSRHSRRFTPNSSATCRHVAVFDWWQCRRDIGCRGGRISGWSWGSRRRNHVPFKERIDDRSRAHRLLEDSLFDRLDSRRQSVGAVAVGTPDHVPVINGWEFGKIRQVLTRGRQTPWLLRPTPTDPEIVSIDLSLCGVGGERSADDQGCQ